MNPKPELFKLSSGLQYRIYKHGTDTKSPTPGQVVTVHYVAWIAENGEPGKEFSRTHENEPFSFVTGVEQVIPGFDEGVLSMHVGEERELVIPPELGYGEHGYPGVIPPHSTLIFRVTLIACR